MAPSKKSGVSPEIDEMRDMKSTVPNLGGRAGAAVDKGSGAKTAVAGKDRKTGRSKKKERSSTNRKSAGDIEDVAFDDNDRSRRGTEEASPPKSRDLMREEIMTQVLKEYHAKPVVVAEVPPKQFVWPCYGLRRKFGWAHVSLHDAVLDGNVIIVKATLLRYIRKYPSRINDHDHWALDHWDVATSDAGAHVYSLNTKRWEEGRTALSLALMEQREDIADLIISVDNTDVNTPDTITGLSPLHKAVLLDLGSSAQKLAFRGANINAADKGGMTPLMLACRLGHETIVDMLVRVFGAETDQADKAGWTCLHYATYHNESKIVQFLLMSGADPDKTDKQGMKAMDWAEQMGLGESCAVFSSFESHLV